MDTPRSCRKAKQDNGEDSAVWSLNYGLCNFTLSLLCFFWMTVFEDEKNDCIYVDLCGFPKAEKKKKERKSKGW